jgi:hypothetical protein
MGKRHTWHATKILCSYWEATSVVINRERCWNIPGAMFMSISRKKKEHILKMRELGKIAQRISSTWTVAEILGAADGVVVV